LWAALPGWLVSFFRDTLFGNMPAIKQQFGLVIPGIVAVSVMPALIGFLRRNTARARER
jgi:hypothetical protein